MRCARRENANLFPLYTSTPLGRCTRPSACAMDEKGAVLSPIVEGSTSSLPRPSSAQRALFSKSRFSETSKNIISTMKKSFAPMVLANSDSEEEEETVKSSAMLTRGSLRKSQKPRSKQSKANNLPPSIPEEPLNEKKKVSKRVSRVDAILEEIVRESSRKSTADIKVKSDESVDAIIEDVIRNRNIDVQLTSRRALKQNVPYKNQDAEKENLVTKLLKGNHEVEVLLVKKPPEQKASGRRRTELASLNPNIENNLGVRKYKRKSEKYERLSSIETNILTANADNCKKRKLAADTGDKKATPTAAIRPSLTTNIPSICTMNEFIWKEVNGQVGVSLLKYGSLTYMKINPKCKILKSGPDLNSELIVIIEGHALVTYDGKKTKVGPGTNIRLPSGYEIQNTGITKYLILISTKVL